MGAMSMPEANSVTTQVEGRPLGLTNLDKPLFATRADELLAIYQSALDRYKAAKPSLAP